MPAAPMASWWAAGRKGRRGVWLRSRRRFRGTAPRAEPSTEELVSIVTDHYSAAIDFYGETLGTRVIRKHLGWYMDAAETPAEMLARS